jgi:hypothetical protein
LKLAVAADYLRTASWRLISRVLAELARYGKEVAAGPRFDVRDARPAGALQGHGVQLRGKPDRGERAGPGRAESFRAPAPAWGAAAIASHDTMAP